MKKILIFATAIVLYLATLYVASCPIEDLERFRQVLGQQVSIQSYKILETIN